MLKQIWNTSKHKEARYRVLGNYILSIITRLDITSGEAEAELSKIIDFKYEREFARICNDVFGMDFRKKRDKIFKPLIEELALKNKYQRSILLKIAIGLGLCEEDDPIEIREGASKWVDRYVRRNYGVKTRELPRHLDPNLEVYCLLKQRVFKYMEDHPIARPKKIMGIFKGESSETIRHYVKEWKKQNKKMIIEHTIKLSSIYTKEMGLEQAIEAKAGDLLKQYIFREDPDLKMKWKGIIAGAIYLACRILVCPSIFLF